MTSFMDEPLSKSVTIKFKYALPWGDVKVSRRNAKFGLNVKMLNYCIDSNVLDWFVKTCLPYKKRTRHLR